MRAAQIVNMQAELERKLDDLVSGRLVTVVGNLLLRGVLDVAESGSAGF
jgi:hypothetical protein